MMSINFTVSQADFHFEAGFGRAEFPLFRQDSSLLPTLFEAVHPYEARLTDMRFEQGVGNVGDYHLLVYLFNYWVTLRVRVDRIEIVGTEMPNNYVQRYGAAVVDILNAMRNVRKDLSYRAYVLAVRLHGGLDGMSTQDFLARFTKNIPDGLGPPISSGSVMYFGPFGDRLTCSLMVDTSTTVPNSLLCRVQVTWDAAKVKIESLPQLANDIVRKSLNEIGLSLTS